MKYTFKQFNTYAALSEEERTQENFDKIFPETLDEGVLDDIAQKAGEVVGKVAKVVGIKSELEKSRDKLKAAQEKRAAAKKAMDAKLKNVKSFDDKAKDLKNKMGTVGAAIEKDRAALKRATSGKYSDSQFAKDLIAQQNESFIEVLNAVVEGYINIDEFITEAKAATVYEITKKKNGKESKQTGTLEELIDDYSYTLETGQSYEREKGNKKINLKPKNIKALVDNLSKAVDNAAANGYSGVSFSYKEIQANNSTNEDSLIHDLQLDEDFESQTFRKVANAASKRFSKMEIPDGWTSRPPVKTVSGPKTWTAAKTVAGNVFVIGGVTDAVHEITVKMSFKDDDIDNAEYLYSIRKTSKTKNGSSSEKVGPDSKSNEADLEKTIKRLIKKYSAESVKEAVAEFLEALRDEVMEEFNLYEDQVQTIDGLVVDKVEAMLEATSKKLIDNSVSDWKKLFDTINDDCDEDEVCGYDDVDFYTSQIINLVNGQGDKISKAEAKEIAKLLNGTKLH